MRRGRFCACGCDARAKRELDNKTSVFPTGEAARRRLSRQISTTDRTHAPAPHSEKRGAANKRASASGSHPNQGAVRAGIQTSRFNRVASAGRTLNKCTPVKTLGASVARGAFISPTAFEQRGEMLWEREGAAGLGGKGGVVIEMYPDVSCVYPTGYTYPYVS